MFHFKAIILASVLSLFSLFVSAQNFDSDKDHLEKHLPKAQRGNKIAQYEVGSVYGSLFYQDYATALQWFLKSAKQGYMPAQEAAGRYFYDGTGTPKDLEQAFYWFQKAANQGSTRVLPSLAAMYRDGEGVSANPRKARELFEKAAKNSKDLVVYNQLISLYKSHFPKEGKRLVYWMEAYYEAWGLNGRELVAAYTEGTLVPKNNAKAFYFLNDMHRRSQTRPGEVFQLAIMYEEGQGVAKNTRKAEELYRQASEAGHEGAIFRKTRLDNHVALQNGDPQALVDVALALLHYKRSKISADEVDQIIQWLEQASQKKHPQARQILAQFYESEYAGHRHSIEKSIALYEEIAESPDSDPMISYHLHRHYLNKDDARSLYWLTASATAGAPAAQYVLGEVYYSGWLGVESDQAQAVEWYRASAEQGFPQGMYEMGHMYDHGHGGLEKDKQKALAWYGRAAQRGHGPAIEKYKQLTEGK